MPFGQWHILQITADDAMRSCRELNLSLCDGALRFESTGGARMHRFSTSSNDLLKEQSLCISKSQADVRSILLLRATPDIHSEGKVDVPSTL